MILGWLIKLTSFWVQRKNFQVCWGDNSPSSENDGLLLAQRPPPMSFNIYVADIWEIVQGKSVSLTEFTDDAVSVIKEASILYKLMFGIYELL